MWESFSLGFSQFVKEVFGEFVLFLLEFVLGQAVTTLNRNIKPVLAAAEQVHVHEVDDARGVVPRPRAQQAWTVNRVLRHVVVQERVEVLVAHAAHLAPESAHLDLGLVVHVANQLLAQLKLHLELGLLYTIQIWTLLKYTS